MEVMVDIEFNQLVKIAKKLPAKQWTKLKAEVESSSVSPTSDKRRGEFKKLLLDGPVFSKKQLDAIAETRKAINQWRKK